MKLSFIVPVYKVEKYLCQCVDSILAQSMDDYEIILVDDGSPDGCPALCDAYGEKYPSVVRVFHKENGGLANARNFGLDKARGDYVYFIDSDDYFINDGVRLIYEKAAELDADVVQSSFITLDEKSGLTRETKSVFECGRIYSHEEMEREICFCNLRRSVIFVWRNLYKREFLKRRGIRFADEMRMIEDAPFNIWAFTAAARFAAADIPVYCYRLRAESLQRQKYTVDYDKWLYRQWRLKQEYYEKNCTPSPLFYEDLAEFTIKAMLPVLLSNVYSNGVKERYKILKRIGSSEMMRKSFKDYDINKFRSKSLDWWMTLFMKKKMYPAAHLLCEKVLYKA